MVPTALLKAIPTSGDAPLTVAFDATGSSHPVPGEPLTYSWDLDGDGVYGDAATAQTSWTYTVKGSYTVGLRVTDSHGGMDGVTQRIDVSNLPPVPKIVSPVSTLTWKVGDVISFSGSATDPEDGVLPVSKLSWSLVIQHCPSNCHTHPVQSWAGVASGSFSGQDHEYPSYLELTLTATDSKGLQASTTVNLYPKTVSLSFASSPPGLQLAVGSATQAAPFARTVIIGSTNSVTAVSPQSLSGTSYQFTSWSDGGAQSHNLVAPATPATYTASFHVVTPTPTRTPTSTPTPDADAHANGNADRSAHGDTDADPDLDSHGDADTDHDGDENGHPDGDAHADADAHAHADPDVDSLGGFDTDADANAHPHGDTDTDADPTRTPTGLRCRPAPTSRSTLRRRPIPAGRSR